VVPHSARAVIFFSISGVSGPRRGRSCKKMLFHKLAVELFRCMAYVTNLQVFQRGGQNRQYYLICPAPLAAALEMEKGEELEWVIKDRNTFEIRRLPANARAKGGRV